MFMKISKEEMELRKYLKNLGETSENIKSIYYGDLYENKKLMFQGILIETFKNPSLELENEIKKLNDSSINTKRMPNQKIKKLHIIQGVPYYIKNFDLGF